MVPIGVEILALVESQELRQRLAIDAHSLLAGAADGLVRLFAGDVHDVERHAGGIGDGDGAVGGFALELGRAGIGVALGAGDALGQHLLLHVGHQIAVLGMDHGQRAQLAAALEGGEHLVILDHQGTLVGHEMLEGVDAHVDGILHLVEDGLVPAGDRHVVADIGTDLRGGFAVPFLDGVLDGAVRAGQAEIHKHRGAATGRGPGAGFEGFGRRGAHEGHFQMGVRVDAAGDHIGAFRIDGLITFQVLADLLDLLVLDQDIGLPRAVCGADGAVLDDFGGHFVSPSRCPSRP